MHWLPGAEIKGITDQYCLLPVSSRKTDINVSSMEPFTNPQGQI